MNERIKELAEQAGFRHPDHVGLSEEYAYFDHEQFALFIVRECLAQVDAVDAMLENDKEKLGVAWVGLAIEKHFGIEE
jgi:hypothetical protein